MCCLITIQSFVARVLQSFVPGFLAGLARAYEANCCLLADPKQQQLPCAPAKPDTKLSAKLCSTVV